MEFFNSTLGFWKTNTSFIKTILKARKTNFKTTSRVPFNKKDDEIIKNHIFSFQPHSSHYRRTHAPNRLYLPPEMSIRFMYNDFSSNTNNPQISYEIYWQNVKKLNISFKENQTEICGYRNNNETSKQNKLEHFVTWV